MKLYSYQRNESCSIYAYVIAMFAAERQKFKYLSQLWKLRAGLGNRELERIKASVIHKGFKSTGII